jgi:threonine/homoserine/homoserine lactone efflux protein
MIDLNTWLLFVAAEFALCVSPGPAVLYVSSHGLSGGFRSSICANLGIVTGNVIYFMLSAIGIGSLILASHNLFLVVKWCGVGYLVWLGLRMLTSSASISALTPANRLPLSAIYRGGVVVQLANPKNLVFFLAILPPFIDETGSVLLQILILGLTSQVIEFLALLSYGAAAGGIGRLIRTSWLGDWVNRVTGSALIAIGVGLAFIRRADS